MRFFHTAGSPCAAVVADISTGANSRARSIFIDQNLAGVGGYTQTLQVLQEVTPGGGILLLMDNVLLWNFSFSEHRYNKGKFY